MKKTIYILLATILLIGMLAACNRESAQSQATASTDEFFVDNVFQDDPSTGTGSQNPDSTTPTQGGQQFPTTKPAEDPTTRPTVSPTQPTEGQQTPTTQPTEGQQPSTSKPTENPEQPTPPANDSSETNKLAAEYEAYDAMTSAEKAKFRGTFENPTEFIKWYHAALKAYKEAHPAIPIPPDGNITLP